MDDILVVDFKNANYPQMLINNFIWYVTTKLNCFKIAKSIFCT